MKKNIMIVLFSLLYFSVPLYVAFGWINTFGFAGSMMILIAWCMSAIPLFLIFIILFSLYLGLYATIIKIIRNPNEFLKIKENQD